MEKCQYCGETCVPKRCTRCRKAFYCSVACQKKDWKAGHKKWCSSDGPSKEKADMALQSLAAIIQGTKREDAHEHQRRSQDEVELLQERDSKKRNKDFVHLDMPQKNVVEPNKTIIDDAVEGQNSSQLSLTTTLGKSDNEVFDVVVEMMQHISRFQILFRRKASASRINVNDARLKVSKVGDSQSLVEIISPTDDIWFSTRIPRLVKSSTISNALEANCLHGTLNYQEDFTQVEMGVGNVLVPIDTINEIKCHLCKENLLPTRAIRRTLELPAGHWDEIADYLICYNGQPVVDFSSANLNAAPTIALQDANTLCLNVLDFCGKASVIPVCGYGEVEEDGQTDENNLIDPVATVRGERNWRDITSGASVCCTKCSAPIGFAGLESPETFRLLKHRISVSEATGGRTNRLSSCASFLMREMVRYAEAKAVFTFIVTLKAPTMNFASNVFTKCILLRLVSWDCNIATSMNSHTKELIFERFAKVVFEETYDRKPKHRGTWEWGGVDLCCPPPEETLIARDLPIADSEERKSITSDDVSATRIVLQDEEYAEVIESLCLGQRLFPRDVANATISVKMGNSAKSIQKDGNGLGLSAISLNH